MEYFYVKSVSQTNLVLSRVFPPPNREIRRAIEDISSIVETHGLEIPTFDVFEKKFLKVFGGYNWYSRDSRDPDIDFHIAYCLANKSTPELSLHLETSSLDVASIFLEIERLPYVHNRSGLRPPKRKETAVVLPFSKRRQRT